MTVPASPVFLDAYAAKKCPMRVHNDFSSAVPTASWQPSPEDQARLDAGLAFESEVFALLAAAVPGAVVISPDLRKVDAIDATVRNMNDGSPLILGGWLPDDSTGGRKGRPDLLIRAGSGYVPGDVKNHATVGVRKTTGAVVSPLRHPNGLTEVAGLSSATSHRVEDGMQLAHYTRLLQACNQHTGKDWLLGAIIGTSFIGTEDTGGGLALVWHSLDEPMIETFSRSSGKKKRSLLERYDHEHAFRLRVAERALLITGALGDPDPLVIPIGQDECMTCPYRDPCATVMGDDDPSLAITMGRLDRREWLTLRALDIDTTALLAEVRPDDEGWFAKYAAEVTHHTPVTARKRLAAAVERAKMIRDGITHYKFIDGPAEVPTATVEIDIDNENDLNNRVYMWGARTRHGHDDTTATYQHFTVWQPISPETEHELAERFVGWLREQRAEVEAAGGTIRVFHWSSPEWSKLKSILGPSAVNDLINPDTGVFVDVEKVFKSQFVSLRGTSIKKIAPLYGFAWRVSDPGGAISQTYYLTQQNSTDPGEVQAAQAWLLSYNEDDNAAVAAVRDGMRRESALQGEEDLKRRGG